MAGIYIHIPFCKRRCGYCDFFSSTSTGLKARVLAAICRELEQRKGFLDGETVETIYIGGGTPSLCSVGELRSLLDCVKENFDVRYLRETTVEANPDDLSGQYLDGLLEAGFDRLSIGIQSFDDAGLCFMNRRHGAGKAIESVRAAQETGFGNISIDLIFGVPGMGMPVWEHNVETALSLGVQHISAYHLSVEDGTPFATKVREGSMRIVSEEVSREQYLLLHERLEAGGFEHYEISNFALEGCRSLHNSNYWKGIPYLGAGPSAHSFRGKTRQWNHASIDEYLTGPGRSGEELTDVDVYNELVMLSLRAADGLSLSRITSVCGEYAARAFETKAKGMSARGLVELSDGHWRIPAMQFLVADSIISEFFEE